MRLLDLKLDFETIDQNANEIKPQSMFNELKAFKYHDWDTFGQIELIYYQIYGWIIEFDLSKFSTWIHNIQFLVYFHRWFHSIEMILGTLNEQKWLFHLIASAIITASFSVL